MNKSLIIKLSVVTVIILQVVLCGCNTGPTVTVTETEPAAIYEQQVTMSLDTGRGELGIYLAEGQKLNLWWSASTIEGEDGNNMSFYITPGGDIFGQSVDNIYWTRDGLSCPTHGRGTINIKIGDTYTDIEGNLQVYEQGYYTILFVVWPDAHQPESASELVTVDVQYIIE